MKRTGVYGVVVMLVGLMIISRYHHPTPAAGAVEIAAAGLRSDQQVLKELVAAFDQAEIAVQQANLEALMSFYGKITTTMVSGGLTCVGYGARSSVIMDMSGPGMCSATSKSYKRDHRSKPL
jgi:hypothetical protein